MSTASQSLFRDPGVRFVGLNVCPADAGKQSALPLVADARAGLAALSKALARHRAGGGRQKQAGAAVEAWRATVGADLGSANGRPPSGGEVLERLNSHVTAGDWIVAAAGSPPGDLLKLWETPPGSHAHIEFAFSCMGHELPAGLGIRMADLDAREIYVVIGDGTYLMAATELATAVQERLKVTVIVLVNGGYMSIRGLQRTAGCASLGTEFRNHESGTRLTIDYAANARSLGCIGMEAATLDELSAALERARATDSTSLIACAVDPQRAVPHSGAFWDLGIAEVSTRDEVRAAAAAMADGRDTQRNHGWRGR